MSHAVLSWNLSASLDRQSGWGSGNDHFSLRNIHLPLLITSTSVDLQLPIDVGFVHERVQHIEDAVDIPDLGVWTQEINLFLRLFGCFAAVLTEGLELSRKKHIHNKAVPPSKKCPWPKQKRNAILLKYMHKCSKLHIHQRKKKNFVSKYGLVNDDVLYTAEKATQEPMLITCWIIDRDAAMGTNSLTEHTK